MTADGTQPYALLCRFTGGGRVNERGEALTLRHEGRWGVRGGRERSRLADGSLSGQGGARADFAGSYLSVRFYLFLSVLNQLRPLASGEGSCWGTKLGHTAGLAGCSARWRAQPRCFRMRSQRLLLLRRNPFLQVLGRSQRPLTLRRPFRLRHETTSGEAGRQRCVAKSRQASRQAGSAHTAHTGLGAPALAAGGLLVRAASASGEAALAARVGREAAEALAGRLRRRILGAALLGAQVYAAVLAQALQGE